MRRLSRRLRAVRTLACMSMITDQRDRPLTATIAIVVAIVTAGYMAPWAIAAARGRSNHWAVFWVNLLTGWTVIGWAIALYMSLTSHRALRRRMF